MYEKVNPQHVDKIADRIAGALVDMAYRKAANPRIAVEVLIGHGVCNIICETSVRLPEKEVYKAVHRIAGNVYVNLRQLPQDEMLAANSFVISTFIASRLHKMLPAPVTDKRLDSLLEAIHSVLGDFDLPPMMLKMHLYSPFSNHSQVR